MNLSQGLQYLLFSNYQGGKRLKNLISMAKGTNRQESKCSDINSLFSLELHHIAVFETFPRQKCSDSKFSFRMGLRIIHLIRLPAIYDDGL